MDQVFTVRIIVEKMLEEGSVYAAYVRVKRNDQRTSFKFLLI